MKDIKINKVQKMLKVNKIEEEFSKEKSSFFSYILLAFMSSSILVYIFFVTSTFYFAIEERQILLQKNSIVQNELTNIFEENKKFLTTEKAKSQRISYINVSLISSISLK